MHPTSIVTVAPLLVLVLSVPAGCSGGGVIGDCQRICNVVAGCYGAPSLAGDCTTKCLDQAGGPDAKPAMTAIVRECADCIGGQSCLGVAAGACNSACPTGSISIPTGPSSSPQTGGCQYDAPREAGSGQVSCERQSQDWFCKCYENGVFEDSFNSLDFCTASESARAGQAAKGCRW